VVSRAQNDTAAEGTAVIVSYDYRRNHKTSLPADVRDGIARLEQRRQAGSDEERRGPGPVIY
jgi:hypothetical protein